MPPISISAFGTFCVYGYARVPWPPHRITTCIATSPHSGDRRRGDPEDLGVPGDGTRQPRVERDAGLPAEDRRGQRAIEVLAVDLALGLTQNTRPQRRVDGREDLLDEAQGGDRPIRAEIERAAT